MISKSTWRVFLEFASDRKRHDKALQPTASGGWGLAQVVGGGSLDLAMVGDLIPFINERHHSSWGLVAQLEGGWQSGAFELSDPSGASLVLKVFRSASEDRLEFTALVIERARNAGWPTPAWRAWGISPDGSAYSVTDFVVGTKLEDIDEASVSTILSVIEMQANLHPETDQDWSSYAWRVVFEGESGFADDLRSFSSEGRDFVTLVDTFTLPHKDSVLPTTDLVHGDFLPGNLLLVDGVTPWVIDVHAVGKGTRVYDVARLITATASDATQVRLTDYACGILDKGALLVCLVANILGIASFGTSNWPQNVDGYLRNAAKKLHAVHGGGES